MREITGKQRRLIYRSAKEIKSYRQRMKLVPRVLTLLLILLLIIFSVSEISRRGNNFMVTVGSGEKGLLLSKAADFNESTAMLGANINKTITNISIRSLPEDLDHSDGDHSGENYMAYTFYCRNSGKEATRVGYEVFVVSATRNIDAAIRLRLYVNGVPTDYARARTDGEPEPDTVAFLSEKTILRDEIPSLAIGQILRFTVVVWLEGDDPECVDSVVGGTFTIGMTLNTL